MEVLDRSGMRKWVSLGGGMAECTPYTEIFKTLPPSRAQVAEPWVKLMIVR